MTTPTRPLPSLAVLLRAEVLDEVRGVYREPAALFFSIAMPVAFFTMFAGLFGGEAAEGGRPAATTMLATFGAYGVILSCMMTPGIGLAEARERGWLRVIRTSPVPVPISLAARVIATVPYSVGILGAMTAAAGLMGHLQITPAEWMALVAALVLGSLPFALIGLAVGSLASGNATTAVLNAIAIPLSIAGGLWFPLAALPGWVQDLAPLLPTAHLADLALAALDGGPWIGHVAVLVATTIATGALAVVAYGRGRT